MYLVTPQPLMLKFMLNKIWFIEKKASLYLLCDDYVSSIADGTGVSTFLCTQKLQPEEVSVSLIAV